ncbi:hypothetical protein SAMN05428952_101015 [Nitrosomonas sp. Nm132]|jgi:hypothetical protein|nr:hypothetical protein SAMN05428952_101015 [Nitrosomonas sp. Nm132]SDY23240.1 hypothetical protein SAMN05421754_100450 [Nitrosomonas sp. Nm58]
MKYDFGGESFNLRDSWATGNVMSLFRQGGIKK